MRRFAALTAVAVACALAFAPAALADRKPYAFDKNHSEVNFVAEALLLSAHGFFGSWEGSVEIDPTQLEDATIRIEIDAASINTRNERRDNHLRSGDFFDVQNNPKITFVSTKVTKVDDKNLKVTGDLTIRGKTKSIEIPVRIVFLRETDGRFKSEFQINRQDFGVSYNSRLNPIEDLVTVQLDVHLQQPRPPAPAQQPAKPTSK